MTIGYQLRGNPKAPRVVFLHGFWGDRRSFDGLIDRLGHRVYALSIDVPGHGATAITADCSMAMVATQTIALLDLLGFWPCRMVGYSMGGRLALYLALVINDPNRLTGLVLESASPGLGDPIARQQRQLADERWAQRLESEPLAIVLDDWYRQAIFARLRQQPYFTSLRSQRLEQHGPSLAQAMRSLGLGQQPNLWPKLPQLRVPTLLLVGDRDPKFIDINQRMQILNPGTITLNCLPNCGHNCHIEATNSYSMQLREFLTTSK